MRLTPKGPRTRVCKRFEISDIAHSLERRDWDPVINISLLGALNLSWHPTFSGFLSTDPKFKYVSAIGGDSVPALPYLSNSWGFCHGSGDLRCECKESSSIVKTSPAVELKLPLYSR